MKVCFLKSGLHLCEISSILVDVSIIDMSTNWRKGDEVTNTCLKESRILYKFHLLNKEIGSKSGVCTSISQSKFELLYQVYQIEEMSQKDLQKAIGIDNAAITRHLKQLEASGMITRCKSSTDNRITLVRITDHGRNKIASFQEENNQFATAVLKGFTEEELDGFLHLLDRIEKNIADM
jgi:DNA-binding MarR family transcriptional regulator